MQPLSSKKQSIDQTTLELLIEEFVDKLRSRQNPDIEEFARRFPNHSDEIRETLEALAVIERVALCNDLNSEPEPRFGVQAHAAKEYIGDFQILREIGRGGMGIVYEAEQISLGRRVALKVIPKSLNKSSISARFKREAKAAAKLHHTNIVPVFGVGADDVCEYYAMQFIEGDSLDRVIQELKRLNPSFISTESRTKAKDESEKKSAGIDATLMAVETTKVADASNQLSAHASPVDKSHLVANVLLSGTCDWEGLASDEPVPSALISFDDQRHLAVRSDAESERSVNKDSAASALDYSGTGSSYWHSVANMGAQIASALAYAHQQGVLHRDIKPANILLDLHGNVWLADFGLAKLQDEANLTTAGDLVGTLRYMAPENFRGRHEERSDIFCLGLTLYELCTLQPAYDQSERRALVDHVSQCDFQSLERYATHVPMDLRTIIQKCLEREPELRYQHAAALEADLRRFLAGEPIRARRVSLLERVGRWSRRNKALASAVAALAVAVCILAIGGPIMAAYMTQVARQSRQLAEQNQQLLQDAQAERNEAARAKVDAEESRDHAIHVAYGSAMSQAAENVINEGRSQRTDSIVNLWRTSGMKSDPREWEWHWLKSHQHLEKHLIFGHSADVRCVIFQPGGQLLASCGVSEGVRIYNRVTGQQTHFLPQRLSVLAEWSPDGSHLVCLGADGGALVFNVHTNALQRYHDPLHEVHWLDWHPRQPRIVIGYANQLQIRDTRSFEVLQVREGLPERDRGARSVLVEWSPNGERIAWCVEGQVIILDERLQEISRSVNQSHQVVALKWLSDESIVSLHSNGIRLNINATTGEVVNRGQFTWPALVNGADWNKDGSKAAVVMEGKLLICDIADCSIEQTWPAYGSLFRFYMRNVSWSDDEQFLSAAFQGMAAPIPIWDVKEAKVPTLRGAIRGEGYDLMPGPVNLMSWSPDGKKLASLSDRVNIWDVSTRTVERHFELSEAPIFHCDARDMPWLPRDIQFSPDGRYLAVTHDKVYVWELDSGKRIFEARPFDFECRGICWSSDSQHLALASQEETPILVWSAKDNSLTKLCEQKHSYCSFVSWHPSKPWLLFNSQSQALCWNFDEGKLEFAVENILNYESLPRWSRKGDRFAINTFNNCLLIVNPESRERFIFDGHIDLVFSLSWSSNDKRLASVDRSGLAIVWDVQRRNQVLRFYKDAVCCQWHPSLPILAVARRNGDVDLLDATRSYLSEQPPGSEEMLAGIQPTPLQQAFSLARTGNWQSIANLPASEPLMVGWWIDSAANNPAASFIPQATPNSAGKQLTWLQPSDPYNGVVLCQPGFRRMHCPIYSQADINVHLAAGLNSEITACRLNGTELAFPQANGGWRRVPVSLKKGWNWLTVEAEEILRSDFAFLQLKLECDQAN